MEKGTVFAVACDESDIRIWRISYSGSKRIKISTVPQKSGMKVKYSSDHKSVVSVSRTGQLKAKKTGTAKISVTVSKNSRKIRTEWFKIKVRRTNSSSEKKGTPVVLTVNGETFQAIFYKNKTADELVKKMPVTLSMKELNGNEKYHYFNREFPTDEKAPGKIEAGDIMLYGSDCLVTFYKSHKTSYEYTTVGKIEDAAGFAKAVGSGDVKITFKAGKSSGNDRAVSRKVILNMNGTDLRQSLRQKRYSEINSKKLS